MGSHTNWLVGSGEMTELIRAHPWSGTPLGDLATWTPALQSAVNLVLNCPFPMALLWGPDFTLLYNDGYRLIAGAKHPAALGKSSREIWPEVWHINQPIFKSVREKDQSIFLEDQLFPIRRSSDELEEAYFTISYSPVYDLTLRPQEAPQARGILVTLLETTSKIIERKKLKNLLIESQRYRDILDQIPAHIYMKDINSKYQYANKTTLELFRCTLEELKGREDEFFFPLETVARLKASDRRVFSGETTRVELEVRDPLGGQRVYDELKTPLYRDIHKTEISGLIAISTDITERKHTEKNLRLSRERFRVAINALGAGFFMRDADGKIVDSNSMFQEIIKLNPDQLRELDTNNLGFKLI
ncbi:PAS domain S-box protein, partial [bacterium]|nr:PAS domain S-box protein [bacterium]